MKKSMMALGVAMIAAAATAKIEQHPDEEEYGQRVWFRQGDKFADGNYRDYFMRSFAGELKRNLEGYKGYCCDIAYADSRPFPVEPGKKYKLSMKVFNCGMKDGVVSTNNPAPGKAAFPNLFRFWKGGEKYPDAWDCLKSVKGVDIPEADKEPLPAKWVDRSYVITVPEGAHMFTFSIGYLRNSNWGRYLIADVNFEEVK